MTSERGDEEEEGEVGKEDGQEGEVLDGGTMTTTGRTSVTSEERRGWELAPAQVVCARLLGVAQRMWCLGSVGFER